MVEGVGFDGVQAIAGLKTWDFNFMLEGSRLDRP